MSKKIYLYKIDREKMVREESQLISLLPDWRKSKTIQIKNEDARIQSLAAGLLLKNALKDYTGQDEKMPEDLKHNLSHSGDFVVAVIGDVPVGIDVEHKGDKGFRVTERMFVDSEVQYIHSALNKSADGEVEAQCRFRDIWTMKESFLKCIGIGITVPLNSFTGELLPEETLGNTKFGKIVLSSELPDKLKTYSDVDYYYATTRLDDGEYSISVCSTEKENICLDIESEEVVIYHTL